MGIFRHIIIYDGMIVGEDSTKTYVQYKYEILGRKMILWEMGEKRVLQVTISDTDGDSGQGGLPKKL